MKSVLTLGILLTGKDMLSPVIGRTNRRLGQLEKRAKAVGRIMTASATAGVAGSMVVGNSIKSLVSSYNELSQAQGEIRSLGIDADGIAIISNEATKFSNEFSGTTAPQFVRASYSIKSGISSLSDTGVAEFTRLSALTAKATLSTTGQMTSLFATGYGIYRKQFEQFAAKNIKGWNSLSKEARDIKFAEHFSAGIAGAVQAFKTNGNQMQSAIEALGATATTSNVPLKEQLAILGLLQKTKSGSESATMYRAFLTSATGASKKLKLQFLDANNQLKSTPKILEQLRSKYGKTLDDMEKQELKKAFGTDEAMAFITMFYDGVDELNQNIDLMGSKMRSGTKDVLTMANAMNQGREFELLDQKVGNLKAVLGKQFAPTALKVATIVGEVTTNITEWTEANPELASNLATTVAGSATLVGVLGTLTIGIKTASFAMGVLGLKSKKNSSLISGVADAVGDLAQKTRKPLSLQMGMRMPVKKTILGRLGSLIGTLSKFARANPISLVASVVVIGGVDAMARKSKQIITDRRGGSSSDTVKEMQERLARFEEQLKIQKDGGTFFERAKYYAFHGSATSADAKNTQRQIIATKRAIARKKSPKLIKEKKVVNKSEAYWKSEQGQKEIATARKKANSFLRSVAPVKKEVTHNKEVHINAPINITVQSINDKRQINELARAVKSEIQKTERSKNNSVSHLDEEI